MRRTWSDMLTYLREGPTEDGLLACAPNGTAAQEMRTLAEATATGDPRLDFTPASVEHLAIRLLADLGIDEIVTLGAYLGEVLQRNDEQYFWTTDSRPERYPTLGIGKRKIDPIMLVLEHTRRAHPIDTLGACVDELLEYGRHPSTQTMDALGWKQVTNPSLFDELRHRDQARMIRRSIRRLRANATG